VAQSVCFKNMSCTDGSPQNDDPVEEMEQNQAHPSIVPRNKMRGLLHNLLVVPEYSDPRETPEKLKRFIVFIVSFCAMLGPMATTILMPETASAVKDLHTNVSTFNVAIGVYLITLGVAPIWWSTFSEKFGRRSIYIISLFLYLVFTIGCATCQNVTSLAIFRILSGGSSASVQSVGAGSIADIYEPERRGAAIGYFYLGPLIGPMIAPIIGGLIAKEKGVSWRLSQWVLVALSGACVIAIIFFFPETLRKQDDKVEIRKILRERLKKHPCGDITETEFNGIRCNNDEKECCSSVCSEISVPTDNSHNNGNSVNHSEVDDNNDDNDNAAVSSKHNKLMKYFRFYSYQPLKVFLFLRYPPAALSVIYSGVCFCFLYAVNLTLSYCYERSPYNFNSLQTGLTYIPNSLAYAVASIFGGKFNDYLLQRESKKYGFVVPEARFGVNIYIASFLLPAALLTVGWCFWEKTFWVFPLIGTAAFGFAQMIIIGVTITYLADCLPGKGASGVAINNFIRMLLAAVVSFITAPLIEAIGVGPFLSICAGISASTNICLILLKLKGDMWRETYNLEHIYNIVER